MQLSIVHSMLLMSLALEESTQYDALLNSIL